MKNIQGLQNGKMAGRILAREDKKPIFKGGKDDLDNLYCSCHRCNKIKNNIFYEDFMEKISQIFIYHMQTQYGNSLRWKFVNRELSKMM